MRTIEETQGISVSDRRILSDIKQVIHGFVPTATVLLFGSVAKGVQDEESDYDILVLVEESLTRSEENAIDRAIYDLELESGILVSAMFLSKREWDLPWVRVSPFHEQVEQDAVVL